jgi:hypothetical protein
MVHVDVCKLRNVYFNVVTGKVSETLAKNGKKMLEFFF